MEGIFIGPQICNLFDESVFKGTLSPVEKKPGLLLNQFVRIFWETIEQTITEIWWKNC